MRAKCASTCDQYREMVDKKRKGSIPSSSTNIVLHKAIRVLCKTFLYTFFQIKILYLADLQIFTRYSVKLSVNFLSIFLHRMFVPKYATETIEQNATTQLIVNQ